MRTAPADLVILDLSLPDRHGLQCLSGLGKRHPGLPVLVSSMHAEEVFALRALEQGAMGYLTKDRAVDEITTALERIRLGRRYIGPDLADAIAARRLGEQRGAAHERLSEREFRVLREVALGRPLAVIAERMHLSPKTVTTYRARLLTKLGLETNAELVRYCVEHQLIA